MNNLNEKEKDALAALARCAHKRQAAVEALMDARAACEVAGFGSEVRAGLDQASDGLRAAFSGLDYAITLIEGT